MFRFHKTYFVLTLLLLFTEILIALYVNDKFVRPYVGDFLVVILLYCFARSILNWSVVFTCLAVLIFSFCVEIAQYFQLVKLLKLENNKLARTVIGSSFEWTDLLAYTLGIVLVLLVEKHLVKNRLTQSD
ncbi:MAG: DUF2809 domain-containing protein [Chitinophagaceae bacterium]|nr:MAG: DUF2809 domain-containing protein [Chitinophagaceae bacterium]